MTECAQIVLVQVKAAADKSDLKFLAGSGINFNNVTQICLKGYKINDAGGAVPEHLALTIDGLGGNQMVNVNTGTEVGALRSVEALYILYPPGGAVTQGRTVASLKHNERSVNIEGRKIQLQFLDTTGTVPVYRPYTNYTEAVIELEVSTYTKTDVVAHRYRHQ